MWAAIHERDMETIAAMGATHVRVDIMEAHHYDSFFSILRKHDVKVRVRAAFPRNPPPLR